MEREVDRNGRKRPNGSGKRKKETVASRSSREAKPPKEKIKKVKGDFRALGGVAGLEGDRESMKN